jgi:SAM-dependent methyltransferase
VRTEVIKTLYRLLEIPQVYRVTQIFARPTIRRFRAYLRENVPQDPRLRVLEIGCGIGSNRPYFECDYTGIDINPDYVRVASRSFNGTFRVMDAAQMSFEAGSFDDAVSIASTHHLSNEQLASMIQSATKLASTLHIIDAILPMSPRAHFKYWWFRMDRGRYARSFDELQQIVSRNAELQGHDVCEGPLHDVCYIRASRRQDHAATGAT